MNAAPLPEHVARVVNAGLSVPRGYASDWENDNVRRAEYMLESAGVQVLGKGAYSIVIPHQDHDKVVKLTLGQQDGYHHYIEWIERHGADLSDELRPHLPVIHSSHVVEGIRITVMERLRKLKSSEEWYSDCLTTARLEARLNEDIPHGWMNDVSSQNVMAREDEDGNVVYVITDPWSHDSDLDDDEGLCTCEDCREGT
jgi:hypothetical protein